MAEPGAKIASYKDLRVFNSAMLAAMRIFELPKAFPVEERYSLTDQMRRSSRSVCANIAEAWRRRRYEAHFVSKLSDAESEAEETRVWLEFSSRCGYLPPREAKDLDETSDRIIGQLVPMISGSSRWTVGKKS